MDVTMEFRSPIVDFKEKRKRKRRECKDIYIGLEISFEDRALASAVGLN
jgi:hypothetical protein